MIKKFSVFVLFILAVAVLIGGGKYYNNKHEKVKADAEIAFSKHLEKQSEIKNLENKIFKQIPGVITWGDSLTAGAGGEGVTYPLVLRDLIKKNIYNIPVENMGVGGEGTGTILVRAGSDQLTSKSFTIPADRTPVEISFKAIKAGIVAPLRQGDGGINPVNINGVQGNISIRQDSAVAKEFHYFFQRQEPGTAVEVKDNTEIKVGTTNLYKNYVPIIFMGQNGGYRDNQDLVNQIESILKLGKYNDQYLVLGLTSGTAASRYELEKLMESTFGKRFLNLREYISSEGLEKLKLKPTDKDTAATAEGSIPPSLLSDQIHFNAKGYTLIGTAVFERMDELGYFDDVKQLAKQIETLKH